MNTCKRCEKRLELLKQARQFLQVTVDNVDASNPGASLIAWLGILKETIERIDHEINKT